MSIKFYHKINGYSNLQINDNVKNSSKYLQKPKRCSALNELIKQWSGQSLFKIKKKDFQSRKHHNQFISRLFSEPRKSQRNESQTILTNLKFRKLSLSFMCLYSQLQCQSPPSIFSLFSGYLLLNFFWVAASYEKASRPSELLFHNVFVQLLLRTLPLFDSFQLTHFKKRNRPMYIGFYNSIGSKYFRDVFEVVYLSKKSRA